MAHGSPAKRTYAQVVAHDVPGKSIDFEPAKRSELSLPSRPRRPRAHGIGPETRGVVQLPTEITLLIMEYLTPMDLVGLQRVTRRFKDIIITHEEFLAKR